MDTVARRYGIAPSELADMPVEEFMFNLTVAGIGVENEFKQQQKAERLNQGKRGRR